MGVCNALDYLQDLGVSCLYLTPIFSSAANHRYHAYDYLQVDPLLGGDAAFDALLTEVHRRRMRLILDGVFNHCGRGFWAFHHLVENGERSPYRHWFHVHAWPLRAYPSEGETCGYSCWWNDPALPKFNHLHPRCRTTCSRWDVIGWSGALMVGDWMCPMKCRRRFGSLSDGWRGP